MAGNQNVRSWRTGESQSLGGQGMAGNQNDFLWHRSPLSSLGGQEWPATKTSRTRSASTSAV